MRHLPPSALGPFLLALGAGCSTTVIGEFDTSLCLRQADGLSKLNPADADYVAFRTRDSIEGSAIRVLSAWGSPCSKAVDAAACNAALAALPIDPPLVSASGFDFSTGYDVIYTRADQVGRAATKDELLALLGNIDQPAEAGLVALANGHELPCGENSVRKEGSSFVLLGTRGFGCGEGNDVIRYEIKVTSSGVITLGEEEVVEEGDPNCAIGRRPSCLRSKGPRLQCVGSFFASAAHLEAASVPAFRHLARELAYHGAPRRLVAAALRSAQDEVRHARLVSRLARRYGSQPARPTVDTMPIRNLVDVATDNAREGCVRETFGAAVASYQARRSIDPVVRRTLATIAVDEARHASLSWAIDTWALSRLPQAQRDQVLEARKRAATQLESELSRDVPESVKSLAGMPSPRANQVMFHKLDRSLFRV